MGTGSSLKLSLALAAAVAAYAIEGHARRTILKTWHPSISGSGQKQTPTRMAITNISNAKLSEVMDKLWQVKQQTAFPSTLLAEAITQIFNRPFEVNKVSERGESGNVIKYELKADIQPAVEFSVGGKEGASSYVTVRHLNRAIRHMFTSGRPVRKTVVGESAAVDYHIANEIDSKVMDQALTALETLIKNDVLDQTISVPVKQFLGSKRSIPIVYNKVTELLSDLAAALKVARPTVTTDKDLDSSGVRVVALGSKGRILRAYATRFDEYDPGYEVFVDWFAPRPPSTMEAEDTTFRLLERDERSMKRLISRYGSNDYIGVREGNVELGATSNGGRRGFSKTEIHDPGVVGAHKRPLGVADVAAKENVPVWQRWLEGALVPQLRSKSSNNAALGYLPL